MKKIRIPKLVALLAVFALLASIAVSVGISAATAEEITETASIVSINVEHADYMHLAFKVETASVPEGAEVGIMVWNSGVKNYTAANAIWSNYVLSNDGAGTDYYASHPIAAKDIATEYQVAVVAKKGDDLTILSKPASYSIEAWAETKLANSATLDEARFNLYNKVIAYGKAASGVFAK